MEKKSTLTISARLVKQTLLQFVQAEIKRLEAQIAVFKTAEVGYTNALKKELNVN